MIHAAQEGKSASQVKRTNSAAPIEQGDKIEALAKEKKRIEYTIASLSRRLEEVEEQLRARGEL
jgi:hypothetical protein